jgi:hypothetical protein
MLQAPGRAIDGAKMSTGLYRLLWRRFDGIGFSFGGRNGGGAGLGLRSALIAMAVVLIMAIGVGAWLMTAVDDGESADGGLTHLSGEVTPSEEAATGSIGAGPAANQADREKTAAQGVAAPQAGAGPAAANAALQPANPEANSAPDTKTPTEKNQSEAHAALEAVPADSEAEPSPIDGLKIGSQSWRRGGLGSKALVTLTLRNENPYPVKDIEIACAFSRRDGSHLTDRKRVIPGTVGSRSRKTFAAVHVGFVNVNASKAKCALVAASKI